MVDFYRGRWRHFQEQNGKVIRYLQQTLFPQGILAAKVSFARSRRIYFGFLDCGGD